MTRDAGAHIRTRVLVVDDEAVIRKTVRAALERAGFAVEEALSGGDALRRLAERPSDVVVLDAMLPDIHGFEVCKQIRQSGLTLPVIATSAFYSGAGYAEDIRQSFGASAVLEKPFPVRELVALVERLADGAGRAKPAEVALSADAAERLARGIEAFKSGDFRSAALALRAAYTLEPRSRCVAGWLGIVYAAGGRDLEALPLLEQAGSGGDATWEMLRNLALSYERTGFRRKALETWARTLAAAPTPSAREEARERLAAA